MATKTVEVKITGISPLLMHAYPLVPIEAVEKKLPREQAELSLYCAPDGAPFVPGINIQRALVAAAAFSKGKGRASLQKQVAACVIVCPERCAISPPNWVVDSRPVVIPATKGRVVRHRPRFDAWSVSFILEYDPVLLESRQVRRIVDDCGSRVGLLDFRPERKGPFGRFMVTAWQD